MRAQFSMSDLRFSICNSPPHPIAPLRWKLLKTHQFHSLLSSQRASSGREGGSVSPIRPIFHRVTVCVPPPRPSSGRHGGSIAPKWPFASRPTGSFPSERPSWSRHGASLPPQKPVVEPGCTSSRPNERQNHDPHTQCRLRARHRIVPHTPPGRDFRARISRKSCSHPYMLNAER